MASTETVKSADVATSDRLRETADYSGERRSFLATISRLLSQAARLDPPALAALALSWRRSPDPVRLVARDGDLIDVAYMPTLRDRSVGRAAANAPRVAEVLSRRGVIEGACAVLGLPIRFLTPPRSATQDASGGRDER